MLLTFLVASTSSVRDKKFVDKIIYVWTYSRSTGNYVVAKNDTVKWTKQEKKVIDAISSLTEVKKFLINIDKQNNDARHLAIWIAQRPNATKRYFWIQVGEDNAYRLIPYLNFYVYPNSMRVMYLNTSNDKQLSLTKWRRPNGL